MQAEERQPEQEQVDGADVQAEGGQEPDNRCDQGQTCQTGTRSRYRTKRGTMAGRTFLPTLSITRFSLTTLPAPTFAPDVANGNFCFNDGATIFDMINSDSSPHTLTVQVVSGVDGLTAGPRSYPVLVTGQRQWCGPFPLQFYGSQLLFNMDSTLVAIQAMSIFGP